MTIYHFVSLGRGVDSLFLFDACQHNSFRDFSHLKKKLLTSLFIFDDVYRKEFQFTFNNSNSFKFFFLLTILRMKYAQIIAKGSFEKR